MNIKVSSFNCRGISNSRVEIKELADATDFLFLQEHWLLKQDLSELGQLHEDFDATGATPNDLQKGPLVGRPFGGVGILWHKKYSEFIEVIECCDERICAIIFKPTNSAPWLFINVYMPYECSAHTDLYLDYLGRIKSIIDSTSCQHTIVAGDFNADVDRPFFSMLYEFCTEEDLKIADYEMLGTDANVFSHISESHGSSSWFDHVICSSSSFSCIRDCSILKEFQCSDHFPTIVTICFEHDSIPNVNNFCSAAASQRNCKIN